jgi:hypothetical protein
MNARLHQLLVHSLLEVAIRGKGAPYLAILHHEEVVSPKIVSGIAFFRAVETVIVLVRQVLDAGRDRLLMNPVERDDRLLRQLLDVFPQLRKLLRVEPVEGLGNLGLGWNRYAHVVTSSRKCPQHHNAEAGGCQSHGEAHRAVEDCNEAAFPSSPIIPMPHLTYASPVNCASISAWRAW